MTEQNKDTQSEHIDKQSEHIDKQTILEFMREDAYKPLTINELEETFEVESAVEWKQLVKLLNQMEDDGEIVRTRTNRYGVPERMNLVRGKIQGNARGFAFLIPERAEDDDVYIAQKDLNGAMNGDHVLVRVQFGGGDRRLEGQVVRILSRSETPIVGVFQDAEHYGFVVPDDKRLPQDIFVPKEKTAGAAEGHKVVVQITTYPDGRRSPEGEVVEILGHKNDPGVDILSIIRKHDLPGDFPQAVMDEAKAAPDTISEEELEGRRDLRGETIVTIDGADAKDLDDAISLTQKANGNYELGVHIADVSHYVRIGSALDQEAYQRGTSVYLVDRVIPMLPHRLSNGICSLNPDVDRLTISCRMEIDPSGEVVDHELFPSVIRSTGRMTYNAVRGIVERDDEAALEKYADLVSFFDRMKELALLLRAKRIGRGAVDFDFKEAGVRVDEDGRVQDVVIRDRSIAEKIIEEFMLAANETVAEHFHWMDVPFIFRVHEDPKPEKLQQFMEFIINFGYVVRGKGNTIHPRALQQLLEEIKDTPEETIISTVMLRSMQQARYSDESLGHFGLASEFYTHFTSPIRRYPDLIVHRLIRQYIFDRQLTEKDQEYWQEHLPDIAERSSVRERLAVDAERETDALKKAEYMMDKIGEEFDGVISGVTSFGMFVELPNTVEGLVHVSYLTDDYYHFVQKQYAMIGERTGNVYRIGDEVRVRVLDVNMEERSIDFELVSTPQKKRRKKNKPSKAAAVRAVKKADRKRKSGKRTAKKGAEKKGNIKAKRGKKKKKK